MQQIEPFSDVRLRSCCIYCGGPIETREHVPSKILLDKPYPHNLPIVPSCLSCNSSFSMDEEYCACILECVRCGTSNPEELRRDTVKRILREKPGLQKRIALSEHVVEGGCYWGVDIPRIRNVLVKIARGHAAFELSELNFSDPGFVSIFPLEMLSKEQYVEFESVRTPSIFPELGSRAMQRIIVPHLTTSGWIDVQAEKYRYFVSCDCRVEVRIVVDEYLGSIIYWCD